MTLVFSLAAPPALERAIGLVAVLGAVGAGTASVLSLLGCCSSRTLARVALRALLGCAAVLAASVPGVAPGWSVATAAVGFLLATQALWWSWRFRPLADYAQAGPPGPDGTPSWWPEFEREFWRYLARMHARSSPPSDGDDASGRGAS